jgi:hypothetical protein
MKMIVLYIAIFIILIPVALLISVFITGRANRTYAVLDDNFEIEIKGSKAKVHVFAEKYLPIMYKQFEIKTPPILWVWSNAVDMGDKIDFIYYNVWENEINPNPLIHAYYSFFRAFYYGYPLYDIEYVQITISKSDGHVEAIMFETGPSDNFYSLFNEHIVLKASAIGEGNYAIKLINRDTQDEIKSFVTKLKFDDLHIKLGVQTWNHLSTLLLASNQAMYTEEVPYHQLKQLSDKEYADYKFVRKSQGEHVTTENRASILICTIATFVFVTFAAKLFSRAKKRSSVSI